MPGAPTTREYGGFTADDLTRVQTMASDLRHTNRFKFTDLAREFRGVSALTTENLV